MPGQQKTTFRRATFAGGCFWCMVHPFDQQPGVLAVISGYTGGSVPNPTYAAVCTGTTGHLEAIQIAYDADVIGYPELLATFWRQIDPTDSEGQFADRGQSYQTAIFYHDAEQQRMAEASKAELEATNQFSRPIVTKILAAGHFYPAEEYHQAFYLKNPHHYRRYRAGSGRDLFLAAHWGEKD